MIREIKSPKIIICDLDGTLFDDRHRQHLFPINPTCDRDYDSYHEKLINDQPYQAVLHLVWQLQKVDWHVIYSTARPERFRTLTRAHLYRFGLDSKLLFMRENDDFRSSPLVKLDNYYKNGMDKANIIFVIDDDDEVVKMWRDIGLTCFQPREGGHSIGRQE